MIYKGYFIDPCGKAKPCLPCCWFIGEYAPSTHVLSVDEAKEIIDQLVVLNLKKL